MKFITDPVEIERNSMRIIAPYLEGKYLTPEEIKVYSRVIHAAGDPDYANVISIHQEAIQAAHSAIRTGCDIFCDVEMVRTGINKKRLAEFGGKVHCMIADEKIARKAKAEGVTRSMMAIREFGSRLDGAILAIGNAPTALFEILHIMEQTDIRPKLIVGVPVGFVGAKESKDALAAESPVPYITVLGNKGGSPIAAATINALVYMLEPQ